MALASRSFYLIPLQLNLGIDMSSAASTGPVGEVLAMTVGNGGASARRHEIPRMSQGCAGPRDPAAELGMNVRKALGSG